jgi:hypothetical protein
VVPWFDGDVAAGARLLAQCQASANTLLDGRHPKPTTLNVTRKVTSAATPRNHHTPAHLTRPCPVVSWSDGLTGMKQVRFGQTAPCLGKVLIKRPAMSDFGQTGH